MNFVEELKWRGMVHDMIPGTEDYLKEGMATAYLGFDPTADSLHIGHLVGVMILKHFQRCGHRPVVLIGGATGMIGDPSGKSLERNLLDEATLRHNQEAIRNQLSRLIDFDTQAPNAAVLVNNYDWMKDMGFLEFIRDIGKHITVNYMMAKDSVKKRFNGEGDGMSFTEFTYQLVQGYDFMQLYRRYNCRLQLGGSDQWGNITTGVELIRRIDNGQVYGMTCPLIKKADGTKFGKTESGNVWLDARYTSPYKFYQFWLNVSDEDAKSYIKIFTFLGREEIEALIAEHEAAPHERKLQKTLARELTCMIHSEADYERAVEASSILFGGATADALHRLDGETLLQVFEGVPQYTVPRSAIEAGVPILDLCVEKCPVFPSKGELRKLIQGGGVSLNKEKIAAPDRTVTADDLIAGKYLVVQKGKKNYFLLIAE
ncbi:MAG TPA: tyrosine--tRNA ligase [Candidatus Tidjanibacter faecipullorum]|uniref:Tyrosine--tRNA ligase n=1 Tax=Candidatus Tidjanibacter faecipullorum TaxID=2838766 RepID=A0A9D2DF61_9BACT|nr:tyrosine--tRNA ligase [Candidatus Tidjanibacter faecipullorum]